MSQTVWGIYAAVEGYDTYLFFLIQKTIQYNIGKLLVL